MPGTGHSARYKGSISNRSKVSPFEQLAKWNQELLGADGMVPSITGGGGGLEFKKLNASDIDGVMTNPASTAGGGSLNMNAFGIINNQQLETSSILFSPPLSTANYGTITSNTNGITVNTNLLDFRATVGRDVIMTVQNDITMRAVKDIDIGPFNTDTSVQKINIGSRTGAQQNKEVNIMAFGTYSGGPSPSFLRLGNATVSATQISSLQTSINGGNTLTLSGSQITIGTNTSRLGFFGLSPTITKPTGVGANITDIHNALISLGLIAP